MEPRMKATRLLRRINRARGQVRTARRHRRCRLPYSHDDASLMAAEAALDDTEVGEAR